MTVLPNTIAALRSQMLARRLGLREAIQTQVDEFARIGRCTHAPTSVHEVANLDELDPGLPLAGVAVAHKDIFDLPGRRPGLGRNAGVQEAGVEQARVVTKLECAGAINLGTLAMAEDACAATGQTQQLPTPINPFRADLAVGGSSSGSAVAVASGMVYASLGTDTAGSVRIPAMTCGVMGLKTTHGLIPRDGMSLLCPSLDSIGVLARSVGDIACVLRVLAPELSWDRLQSARDIRIGYWLDGIELDAQIKVVAARAMRQYGQEHIAPFEHYQRASALQEMIMAYEVGQTQTARIASGQACRQVQSLGAFGLTVPKAWWHEALRQRPLHLQAFVEDVFGKVDVLLAPLQTGPIPRTSEVYLGHGGFQSAKLLGLHQYCGWVNYLGLPSLSLPVGIDGNGLPVSIQLVGRPFGEPQLLALGKQLQHEIHGEQGIMPVLRIEGQE